MSLFSWFRSRKHSPRSRASGCRWCWRTSASRQRAFELVAVLQEEILAVIAKHMQIDRDKVNIKLDRGDEVNTLEIDIEMPAKMARA